MSTVYVCEACKKIIEPGGQVVLAIEQVDATTFGPTHETIEGQQTFFHLGHWPGSSRRWKERGRGTLSSFVGG